MKLLGTELICKECGIPWAKHPCPVLDRSLELIGGTPLEIALALHNDAITRRYQETNQ